MDIRELTEADAQASTVISRDAFGGPLNPAAFSLGDGLWRWGIFDGETLVAKANDRAYDSLIGGRPVPTAGVAGVAVVPEYRGRGLARQVMTHLLHRARDRGAVISTLFRTAPGLYRSLGYEQVAELIRVELPTAALAGRVPDGITLRRALVADAPAIRAVYQEVARQGSCWFSREDLHLRGTDESLLASFDGITLALDADGAVVGYAGWNRGAGYGAGAMLEVGDLLATTPDGYRGLLAALASFGAVTPRVQIRSTGSDPLPYFVFGPGWSVTDVQPYLLRVVDLAGAVAARGWPVTLDAAVDLTVDDQLCPWNAGRFRLSWQGGRATLEPRSAADSDPGYPRLTATGAALLVAGGLTCDTLRRAGVLSGADSASAAILDAAMAGPRPGILDYF